MAMNIGGINSGIVSGTELERVSREVFGSAQIVKKSPATDLSVNFGKIQQVDTGINLFEKTNELSLTKQIATSKTDLDIQLSQSAMANINALNILAAKSQASNIHKIVEGKVHIPAETVFENAGLKSVFSLPSNTKFHNTMSLEKDRKGSNPFAYVPQTAAISKKEEKDDMNLSIFA